MQTDAFGRLLDIDAPESVQCAACHGRAERLSSAFKGQGIAHHNYRCRNDGCPAGGTIIEHERGGDHRVGPVFGDRDLAVRLATREQSDVPAETQEAAP
jgi:hypothetical protein